MNSPVDLCKTICLDEITVEIEGKSPAMTIESTGVESLLDLVCTAYAYLYDLEAFSPDDDFLKRIIVIDCDLTKKVIKVRIAPPAH